MVRPSQRREMARQAVTNKALSVRYACEVFGVSQTCYRYQPKLVDENAVIADWLLPERIGRSFVGDTHDAVKRGRCPSGHGDRGRKRPGHLPW